MVDMPTWQAVSLLVLLLVATLLLTVWWRQQTFRWPIVLVLCLALAPALSWWSGIVFKIADYRAGCDGLCLGYRGAPLAIFASDSAGSELSPLMFAVNTALYLVLALAWMGALRAISGALKAAPRLRGWLRVTLMSGLIALPLAFAPVYIPPPEAHVRGDPLRIAINARREVYLYFRQASTPILRVALADVRPRRDGQTGMRVCLRTYSYFYLPAGQMYLDMTPEGVHSDKGGVLSLDQSCWD